MTDEQKPANATPLCWVRPATTIPELNGFQVCREGEGFPVYEHPPATPVIAEPVGYVSKQAIERFQDGRHADIYPSIEELTHEFFDATPMALYADSFAFQAQQEKIQALESEVSGLRAARIAYANEFPPDAEGNPDVGNIHANIRKLKAQAQQPVSGADGLTEIMQPIETIKYWADAYANPEGDEHFMGHGMVVTLLREYAALRTALAQKTVSGADVAPQNVADALDLMDALLAPERGLLAVPYTSATVTAAREDLALIRAALTQQDADKVDAERYRWLRNPDNQKQHHDVISWIACRTREDLDAAIDTARKEQE